MSTIMSTFQLTGLHCDSCKKITEKRVQKIVGVNHVETDLDSGKLVILAERAIAKSEVAQALGDTDYQVN